MKFARIRRQLDRHARFTHAPHSRVTLLDLSPFCACLIGERQLNLHCLYCISFLGWPYSSGFINDTMIKEQMPPPGPDTQILMCGPPPMINYACIPNLEKLGYTPDMYFPF